MFDIKSIPIEEVVELRRYQQPSPKPSPYSTVITLLRGFSFYARCVRGQLQELTANDTSENIMRSYNEAILFEEKLGSKLL